MGAPGLCYLLFNGTNWERELEIMAKNAAFAGIYYGAVAFNLPTVHRHLPGGGCLQETRHNDL